jgi:hypothetical protein
MDVKMAVYAIFLHCKLKKEPFHRGFERFQALKTHKSDRLLARAARKHQDRQAAETHRRDLRKPGDHDPLVFVAQAFAHDAAPGGAESGRQVRGHGRRVADFRR